MDLKPKPSGSASSMVWERISIDNASPDNIRYRLVKVFQSRDILWHPKHNRTDPAALHRAWKEVVKFTNIHGLTVKNAKLMIREIVDRCQKVDVNAPEWQKLGATFLTKSSGASNAQPVKEKETITCRACLREYDEGDDRILPLISTYINRILLADIYRELIGEDETIPHTIKCRENTSKFKPVKKAPPVKPVPPIVDEMPEESDEEEGENDSGDVDSESSTHSDFSEGQSVVPDDDDEDADEEMMNGDHDSAEDIEDEDSDSSQELKPKPKTSSELREICPICGELRYLRLHMQIHGKRPCYYCHHCSRCYSNKNYLKTHILTQHMGHRYKCQYCGKTLKSPTGLQKHLEIYHFKPTLPCPICSKMFGSVKRLRVHLRTVHITERSIIQCPECSREFSSKAALYQHRQSHHVELELPCAYCKRVFGTKSNLQRHIQRCHAENINYYPCPVCSRRFAQNITMRMHVMKMHPEYKQLPPKGTVLSARALDRSARVYEQHKFAKVKNVWKQTR